MILHHLLAHLDRPRRCGAGYIAYCRGHDDRKPSLSLRLTDKGAYLKCFAGCEFPHLLEAHGLKRTDLLGDVQLSGFSREERPATPEKNGIARVQSAQPWQKNTCATRGG